MAEEKKKIDVSEMDYARKAEGLQERMDQDAVFENPVYLAPEEQVRFQHQAGHITDEELVEYNLVNKLRNKGMWHMSKKEAQTSLAKGFVTKDMASAYIEFQGMKASMHENVGSYVLSQITQGIDMEEIQAEMNGLEIPIYGPEDLAADVLTFGAVSAYKIGIKQTMKLGAEQIAKSTARETAFGATAGAAMTGVGFVTDSGTVQLLSGLLTPMGASVVLGMTRNTLKQFLMQLKRGNPKAAKAIVEAAEETPSDKFLAMMRAELDEAELGTTKQGERLYEPHINTLRNGTEPTPHQLKQDAEISKVSPTDGIKSQSIMQAIKKGETIDTEGLPSKMVENIEKRGNVEATDLIDEVRKTFVTDIDKARGGTPDPITGTRVPWKQQEAEALTELKKMAEWTGQRVPDMKKIVGYGQDLQQAVRVARRQTRAFNQVFGQYTDEIKGLIKDARTFEDELKALEHIRLFGQMTQSVYGVRSEWGRGLQAYNMPWMKSKFDFESVPTQELKKMKHSERAKVKKILKGFDRAKGRRMQSLR
ncbi:MAG: hypothetical protein JRC86_03580, partial [Deltaproteobacteria bacterium]|nr:hypothetical protein [Deltaproteobacteria bacterium]